MIPAAPMIDIFLQPGEFYFGDADTRIRTLLGSCVSITLWHPKLKIGGMCHYMLPTRGHKHGSGLDGRYADEAMFLFLREVKHAGTRPHDYEVKFFGGGNMFPHHARRGECQDVACKNVKAGRTLLHAHGFKVKAEHVGGAAHRNLVFDVSNGDVWMRAQNLPAAG